MTTIRVVLDQRDLRTFLSVPSTLGIPQPVWRSRLTRQLVSRHDNPFLRHAEIAHFVAFDDADRPVGRVSAFVDDRHSDPCGCFGLFECANDPEAASALLNAASDWLGRRDRTQIRGPLDPTSFVMGGVMVKGFDASPTLAIPSNPEYYADLLEGSGFSPEIDLLVWRYGQNPIPKQVQLISRAVAQHPGLNVRKLNPKRFESQLDIITDVYNAAWKNNWSYSPVDREDMRWLLQDGNWIDYDLSFIAYVDGVPAAIAVACPSFDEFNASPNPDASGSWLTTLAARAATKGWIGQTRMRVGDRPKAWRQLLFGIVPEYRGGAVGGMGAHLYQTVRSAARDLGYRFAETAWTTSADQVLNSGLKVLGAEQTKIFCVYERTIGS